MVRKKKISFYGHIMNECNDIDLPDFCDKITKGGGDETTGSLHYVPRQPRTWTTKEETWDAPAVSENK